MKRIPQRAFVAASAIALLASGVSLSTASADTSMHEGGPVIGETRSQDTAKTTTRIDVSVDASPNGSTLKIKVLWNKKLQNESGRHRFAIRVMATGKQITQRVWTGSRSSRQVVNLSLSPSQERAWKKSRKTGDAIVAVTQQWDSNTDDDKLFERNYVSVMRIKSTGQRQLRQAQDCSNPGPSQNLAECDLQGAYLVDADLFMADMYQTNASYSNMSGADVIEANLTEANFYKANLSGLQAADTVWNGVTCPNGTVQPSQFAGAC